MKHKTFRVVVKNNDDIFPVGGLSKYAAKKLKKAIQANHPEYNVAIEVE